MSFNNLGAIYPKRKETAADSFIIALNSLLSRTEVAEDFQAALMLVLKWRITESFKTREFMALTLAI